MKLFPKILLVVVMMASTLGWASAQSAKIGHINTSKLLQIMPGRDTAQTALEDYAKSLQNDLKTYQQEFEKKYQKYMEEEANMPELMKETRQEELMQMEERVRKYQESAQQDLKQKEQELLQPILQKAQDAIDKVAEEKEYTYILDTSQGSVVFVGDKGKDIMSDVKEELGIEDVPLPEDDQNNQLQPVQQPNQQPVQQQPQQNPEKNIEMPDQED
ncbi:MAG: OmpH family outer membrane protein [Bacteroidales bacterium]